MTEEKKLAADDFTLVYTPYGTRSHVSFNDSSHHFHGYHTALCEMPCEMGTGNMDEIDKAKSMPLCIKCRRLAQNRGLNVP